MNEHISSGRLVADPELKKTTTGISVCSFRLAVPRPKVKDKTDFLNYVAWRQSAEYLCQYGKKGDWVEVVGTLTSRNYEDTQGNKRTILETAVDELKLLSGGSSGATNPNYTQAANAPDLPSQCDTDDFIEITSDDELPF